jgi:hypothetical protein
MLGATASAAGTSGPNPWMTPYTSRRDASIIPEAKGHRGLVGQSRVAPTHAESGFLATTFTKVSSRS